MRLRERITSFTDEHEYLHPLYNANFNYMGSKWSSIQEAYNALVEEGYDIHRKLSLMGNIIYHCYSQNDAMAAKLMETKGYWLQHTVKDHDNFWHNCSCLDCFMENGDNYYGRLVMEVRDYFLWKNKHHKVNSKRWELHYFDK